MAEIEVHIPREIELLEQAAAYLAECRSLDQVKSIRDKAEAIRLYQKKIGASQESQTAAAEIKVRAERRMGELLKVMPKPKNQYERRSRLATGTLSLKDMGVTKSDSSRYQTIANLPEEEFEEEVKKGKQNHRLTSDALIVKGKSHQRKEKRRQERAAMAEEAARRGLTFGGSIMPCLFAQADAGRLPLPDGSVDLVLGSPPYIDARLYFEDGRDLGIARNCEEWVAGMMRYSREALRVSRGMVLWVVAGKTDGRNYQPGPEGLIWEWYKSGGFQECPCYWHRVGIAGSGHDQWFRKDVEYVVAFKRDPVLPWSDNTANGHPPKWAAGGEMNHRVTDGTLRDQWGHSGTGERAERRKDGSIAAAGRPSHRIATKGDAQGDSPPVLANPGNMIVSVDNGDAPSWASSVIHVNTGGGFLGWEGASENEAPYPQALAEWFIRSFCPPGGIVLDPFSGSGTTVRAALALGRRGIGLDLRMSQCQLGIRGVEHPHQPIARAGG
jgi:hypothetical protein